MYQNTLNLTRRLAAVGLFARSVFSGHPNLSWIIPLKTEFGRVVQHKQHIIGRLTAAAGGLKMPGENVCLGNPIVGKKPLRRLGVRPILTGKGYAVAHRSFDLPRHNTKTLV